MKNLILNKIYTFLDSNSKKLTYNYNVFLNEIVDKFYKKDYFDITEFKEVLNTYLLSLEKDNQYRKKRAFVRRLQKKIEFKDTNKELYGKLLFSLYNSKCLSDFFKSLPLFYGFLYSTIYEKGFTINDIKYLLKLYPNLTINSKIKLKGFDFDIDANTLRLIEIIHSKNIKLKFLEENFVNEFSVYFNLDARYSLTIFTLRFVKAFEIFRTENDIVKVFEYLKIKDLNLKHNYYRLFDYKMPRFIK